MYRFKIGQELYLHKTNDLVTVVDTYKVKPNNEPTYLVRNNDTGFEWNAKESHLYTNPNQFNGARFRVDEIVYFISDKKPVKTKKYVVDDIYFDDYSQDIIYVCSDSEGNQKKFWGHQIYNYPFSNIPR